MNAHDRSHRMAPPGEPGGAGYVAARDFVRALDALWTPVESGGAGELLPQAAHVIARAAARVLHRLLATVRRWRLERATYHQLMGLDDRTLHDIGLSRSDIRAVAHGTWEGGPAAPEARARPEMSVVARCPAGDEPARSQDGWAERPAA